MLSNQHLTMQAPLTPEMIKILLTDPTSWLSKQQQNALDERFRRYKEQIKREYFLVHGKEMDERIAEVETWKLLHKLAEQARVQGLNEYCEEQHQLALKVELETKMNKTSFNYSDALLTRQADLAQAEVLLYKRNLELTAEIKRTQDELKTTRAELEIVTRDWTEAKIKVQQASEQIDYKFNNDTITIDQGLSNEQKVSVSANVLEGESKSYVIAYREEARNQFAEKYNNGSMRNHDGSLNEQEYEVFMIPALMPVFAKQKVKNPVQHAIRYARALKQFMVNFANNTMELEILNNTREELVVRIDNLKKELACWMREQAEVLDEIEGIQEENSELRKILAAVVRSDINKRPSSSEKKLQNKNFSDATLPDNNDRLYNSPCSDASLMTKFGLYDGQREQQQRMYHEDKQLGTSLEEKAPTVAPR